MAVVIKLEDAAELRRMAELQEEHEDRVKLENLADRIEVTLAAVGEARRTVRRMLAEED